MFRKRKKDSNVFQTFLIAISQLFILSGNELSHNQTYTIFFVTYVVMNIIVFIVLYSRLPWTWKTQLLTLKKFAHLAMTEWEEKVLTQPIQVSNFFNAVCWYAQLPETDRGMYEYITIANIIIHKKTGKQAGSCYTQNITKTTHVLLCKHKHAHMLREMGWGG